MSPPTFICCGFIGHYSETVFPVDSIDREITPNTLLDDLFEEVEEFHLAVCNTALERFQPQANMLISLSTPVLALYNGGQAPTDPDRIHILFDFDPNSQAIAPPRPASYNCAPNHLDIFRLSDAFLKARRLPLNSRFDQFSRISGTYYIDDSDFVGGYYASGPAIPVIRRPRGFGKSTFLSMLAVYFDTAWPYRHLPIQRVLYPPCPQRLLVLWVDFCDLSRRLKALIDSDSDAYRREYRRVVEEFWIATFQAFYARHGHLFTVELRDKLEPDRVHYPYDLSDPWFLTWNGFKLVIESCNYHIFVAVDNYTAPFLDTPSHRHRDIGECISEQIIVPILYALRRFPMFAECTQDLTDDPAYAGLIGFSYADVVDLGHAVMGSEFDLGAKATFSAQAIASLLSGYQTGDQGTLLDVSVPCFLPSFLPPGQIWRTSAIAV
ncbi:hypothetical protein EXIGLDRAFT_769414 [Exidia glandulosa HHB12029]|uniref:AAA-ATPase-like domain-containing protein n=1 Tax=Exidia glandulosa HHB12029 TaxID=1314781 RepID=A0A165HIG6_EXIGL|nr:hypothetical protein EXIGLDRAFT_769414 [Exidia glandulosa HHB12029]